MHERTHEMLLRQIEHLRLTHDIPPTVRFRAEGAADDTAAIQWLLDHVYRTTRGDVRGVPFALPPAEYRVSDTLYVRHRGTVMDAPGCEIVFDPPPARSESGAGGLEDDERGSGTLLEMQADRCVLNLQGTRLTPADLYNAWNRDLCAIKMTNANDCRVLGPHIYYWQHGIWLLARNGEEGSQTRGAAHNEIEPGFIQDCKLGIRITDAVGGPEGYCNGNNIRGGHYVWAGEVYSRAITDTRGAWEEHDGIPAATHFYVDSKETSGCTLLQPGFGGPDKTIESLGHHARFAYLGGEGCRIFGGRAEGANLVEFGEESIANVVIAGHGGRLRIRGPLHERYNYVWARQIVPWFGPLHRFEEDGQVVYRTPWEPSWWYRDTPEGDPRRFNPREPWTA